MTNRSTLQNPSLLQTIIISQTTFFIQIEVIKVTTNYQVQISIVLANAI